MPDHGASLNSNLLLATVPAKDQRRLLRRLQSVTLRANEHLYEVGLPIRDVHFPRLGCLISVVKVLDDHRSFDAGPVGYEGAVGIEGFLGAEAYLGATVRAGGGAFRMSVKALKDELRDNRKLAEVLLRYLRFLFVNVSQVAGCNCFHPLEKHFCSWLLTLHDRIKSDELEITHELFAKMLGVRRVGITQAARKLQEAGAIRYSWGKLTILDRQQLERCACVCYRQHTQAYQRLLDPAWPNR
jgi:CRP-like cAMP-binding protein